MQSCVAARLCCLTLYPLAGERMPPQCTLGYAAPEVVIAYDEKRNVVATAALDVWGLGVIIFEAFTRQVRARGPPLLSCPLMLAGCTGALTRLPRCSPHERDRKSVV